MKLQVNGEEREFDSALTVAQLLEALEVRAKRVAVMVNDEVVKREQRIDRSLAPGDRVEIIQMVGGG